MPARLGGKVSPARRNALLSPRSAATIDTRDAAEATADGPWLVLEGTSETIGDMAGTGRGSEIAAW